MKLKIELVRSTIGKIPKHRATIRALGLKKMHQVVVHDKNPMILGMVKSVDYMLRVEEVKE